MSDTCIVCLGDLSNGNGDASALPTTRAKSPPTDDDGARDALIKVETTTIHATRPSTFPEEAASEIIAHLRPCGHYLHNECLTPWVERANSCPICRANFNMVELMHAINGDVISSYKVEDRTQVAELDPSMFLESPDEEDEDQPCQACGEDDNEDVLMYCDGCGKLWHTYCVDLQEVPYGHWFCDNCRAQRDVDPRPSVNVRPTRVSRRRTRGQQRRQRGHAPDSSWNEVWQSVWSRINLDLDFPYEEDESSATYLRRHRERNRANRQAHDAWLRRMQVAELHGVGNRFRETEPAMPASPDGQSTSWNRRIAASPLPRTENPEELMAWHAFEQARAASNEPPSSRKRKRASATSSPVDPAHDASPVIKRRRPTSSPRASSDPSASRPRARPSTRLATRLASPISRRPPLLENGPSFLQSLLQEVEEFGSGTHAINLHRPSPRPAGSPTAERSSPRPSSPALSPQPSNHSSPRAMSATPPPPPGSLRPSSPTGLSSSIQPVFPSTEYSPLRPNSPEPSAPKTQEHSNTRPQNFKTSSSASTPLAQPRPRSRIPMILENVHPAAMRPQSLEISPTRATMSLTAKEDVQKLVASALKPHYTDHTISKDEYTTINRDISRMLYDKIGDFEALDVDGKAKWEKVAGEEVNKAVNSLKAQG